jgi:hypothetical protein
MPEIRPLTAADIPAVTRLLRDRIENWPGDEAFLKGTVLDHPWSDPELPSLVAIGENGEIAGFVGVQARRLRVEGESVRGVVCSHLAVADGAGAAGALLLSRLLRGDQAMTWSDSANEPVVRMWMAFGGQLDHSRAYDWMLLLRPFRWMRNAVTSAVMREPLGRNHLPVGGLPINRLAARLGKYEQPQKPAGVVSAKATPADIEREFGDSYDKWAVAVDHDAEYLAHVFRLIERTPAAITCRLVRQNNQLVGWYAYVSKGRGATRVLHLAAQEKRADAVLAELVEHATASGATVLTGRSEPHLDRALEPYLPVLGFARRPVLHSRDPKLLAALASSSSLLTQLDSEWFVP